MNADDMSAIQHAIRERMRTFLDGKDFYDLAQRYRMVPVEHQKLAMDLYQQLKMAILRQVTTDSKR